MPTALRFRRKRFDQVLVFTHVRLHNQSKQPIFLHQIVANATLADGIHSSYAATPTDFERIFKAYPQLDAVARHSHLARSHHPTGRDKRRHIRLFIPHDKGRLGRAQEPGLFVQLPVPAVSDPGAQRPDY